MLGMAQKLKRGDAFSNVFARFLVRTRPDEIDGSDEGLCPHDFFSAVFFDDETLVPVRELALL